MSGENYFAGLRLRAAKGLSSDDVILFKRLESGSEILEDLGLIFLPTISDKEITASDREKTRILFTRFHSWTDYVAVSRPLSFSVEDVERAAQIARSKEKWKVIASLACTRFSQLRLLAKRLADKVDGFEIDLGLMHLLAGGHRSFESFAIDVVEEFVAESVRPVFVKLSPNIPLSQELLQNLASMGIAGMVFTPHLTYSIGRELFTVHSAYLSRLYALIWANLIAGSSFPTVFVSDVPENYFGDVSIEKTFDVILFDTALLSRAVELPKVESSEDHLPVRWSRIPVGLRPAVDVSLNSLCSRVCPYGALNAKERASGEVGGVIVASETCDGCGLCLSLCKGSKLMAVLTPE